MNHTILKSLLVLSLSAMMLACGGSDGSSGDSGDVITDTPDATNTDIPTDVSADIPEENVEESTPPAPTAAAPDFFDGVQPLQTVSSMLIGHDFPVDVLLPEGYADSPEKDYPVIYTTDGQWVFPAFSQITQDSGKEVILVSIHFPTEDRRGIDFLLPGSLTYYDFLRDELMPIVEGQYRIDSNDRTYVGGSFGGMLGSTMLLVDDTHFPIFGKYLLFDPPFEHFHPQETARLIEQRFEARSVMDVDVLLTSALVASNIPVLDAGIQVFFERISDRGFDEFSITKREFEETHHTIGGVSFEWMLDEFFPDPKENN